MHLNGGEISDAAFVIFVCVGSTFVGLHRFFPAPLVFTDHSFDVPAGEIHDVLLEGLLDLLISLGGASKTTQKEGLHRVGLYINSDQ